jgi:hypothetical protein
MISGQRHDTQERIVQAKGNLVSNMGEDKVMFSVQNGKYYNLGMVGGRVWELIEDPITIDQLIRSLMTEYDVEQSVCEEQVIGFLELLMKEGLIQSGSR